MLRYELKDKPIRDISILLVVIADETAVFVSQTTLKGIIRYFFSKTFVRICTITYILLVLITIDFDDCLLFKRKLMFFYGFHC